MNSRSKRKKKRILKIVRNIAIVLIPVIIIALLAFRYATDAKGLLAEVNVLKTELNNIVEYVKEKDVASAQNETAKFDESLSRMNKTLSTKRWKTLSRMPFVGKYVDSANILVTAAKDASRDMLKPAFNVMEEYPLSELKTGDGFSVSTINAYLDLVEDIVPKLDDLSLKLKKVKLPAGKADMINEYAQKLTELTQAYKDNNEYLPLCREFLGHGEDKLYLLVAQNTAEIRAAGGFPGSMGTIRIEDGVLSIEDFKTVYDVLDDYPSDRADISAEEYELYSDWVRFARDAGYNPDFERVAEVWAYTYEDKNNVDVDGVVSLTPAIIQNLLQYIGSVTLSDGTELNGDNATEVLQKELYYRYLSDKSSISTDKGNDFVDGLFAETAKVVMEKLVSDFDTNRIAQYTKIFTDGGKDRTIMMWMKDDTAQEYVRKAGCSGALNFDSTKPEAGIFYSVANGCKLGWFVDLDTEILDQTDNSDGSTTYDIKVDITNGLTNSDMYRAGSYILGNYNGNMECQIHLFAPMDGSISDVEVNRNINMKYSEYEGLEVAYSLGYMLAPGKTIEITYKVTTSTYATEPLEIVKTPTLQAYR